MGAKLKKRYGLAMAIAMVVGIVIGSGVFFKAEKILVATKGDLKLGILSWILGGIIMIVCAYAFAILGTKYEGKRTYRLCGSGSREKIRLYGGMVYGCALLPVSYGGNRLGAGKIYLCFAGYGYNKWRLYGYRSCNHLA